LHLHADAIHLFGGLWADRRMFFALLKAQTLGIKTGLITEPYADASVSYFGEQPRLSDRLKMYLRPIAYRLGGRLMTSPSSFVFAISAKAVRQFEKIGFKADHVFPFGYFVPQAMRQLKPQVESTYMPGPLRLIFVGSLISRKGLAVLVEALVKLNRQGLVATLDLYGSGDPSAFVSQSEHVRFKELIPFGEVQPVIAAYDLLILPSLLQGVPVIASDAVGASTLIEVSGAGAIFTTGDSSQLASILSAAAHNPSTLKQWQEAAFNYKHALQPEVAGNYMHECLQYAIGDKSNRPVAPWYLAH
jgi:glycosyltransferase involved in cell wall biosynthesis